MSTLLVVIVLVLLLGGYPGWGIHQWGYAPMGLGGILLLILIVLLLTGRI